MQYIDLKFWLIGDILQKADKMSMAHSLETRVPYLDIEVYKTARKLSFDNKIRKTQTKYAFREAAHSILPEQVATRKNWDSRYRHVYGSKKRNIMIKYVLHLKAKHRKNSSRRIT